MSLIDNYDYLAKIQVDTEMVESFKNKIMNTLKKEIYVNLTDQFSKLSNYSIRCSLENEQDELDKYTKELSNFMAYQEALYEMMLEGTLMPVKVTNAISYGNYSARINYSIGNTSAEPHIFIPILTHDRFMLKPSLMNK